MSSRSTRRRTRIRRGAAASRAPDAFTHLAWGAAELRFAQQIHEQEYGLRASLAALYRALRDSRRRGGRGARGGAPRG